MSSPRLLGVITYVIYWLNSGWAVSSFSPKTMALTLHIKNDLTLEFEQAVCVCVLTPHLLVVSAVCRSVGFVGLPGCR